MKLKGCLEKRERQIAWGFVNHGRNSGFQAKQKHSLSETLNEFLILNRLKQCKEGKERGREIGRDRRKKRGRDRGRKRGREGGSLIKLLVV